MNARITNLLLLGAAGLTILPMGCNPKTPQAERPVERLQKEMKLSGAEAKQFETALSNSPSLKGLTLNSAKAAELEERLKTDPEDISARGQLLTYYGSEQYKSAAARKARQEHVLWVIEHRPETSIRGPEIRLDAILDGEAYQQGKTLWQKQVEAHPKDTRILDHAADYLLIHDRAVSEQLWKTAQELEPDNPRWPERLARLYALNGNLAKAEDNASATKALEEMEKAQALSGTENFDKLGDLAKMAFKAGEFEKARGYANDLLQQAPQHRKAWNYGNALHHGHLVLGRIALRDGKLEDAKNELLASGQTPGSPQLNSFGPNMSLAKDILAQKGGKETVLAYLESCRTFWKMGGTRLDKWSEEVKQGRTPDFGANLLY